MIQQAMTIGYILALFVLTCGGHLQVASLVGNSYYNQDTIREIIVHQEILMSHYAPRIPPDLKHDLPVVMIYIAHVCFLQQQQKLILKRSF